MSLAEKINTGQYNRRLEIILCQKQKVNRESLRLNLMHN